MKKSRAKSRNGRGNDWKPCGGWFGDFIRWMTAKGVCVKDAVLDLRGNVEAASIVRILDNKMNEERAVVISRGVLK